MNSDQHSRRRFLSGSAAVPVILTVQSGSAVAATSSACQIRDAARATPTLLPIQPNQSISGPSPDEWVRRNIQLVKLKVNGVPYKTSTGNWIQVFRNRAGTYYYRFLGDNVTPTLLNGVNDPRPPGQVVGQTIEEINVTNNGVRSALIRVDSTGAELDFFWATAGGQKITKSCWTSFK
ncbi:MAG: hypothetical protein U1F52_12365 [Burkholderiales bacterium]